MKKFPPGQYYDKGHQIWLWWAIDHDTGEVIAFWFGTREHDNLDKLLELLAPLRAFLAFEYSISVVFEIVLTFPF